MKPKFKDLAAEWLNTTVRRTCKRTTYQDYAGLLDNHLLPAFGDMPVDRINRGKVKRFLITMARRDKAGEVVPVAASTRTHAKNVLSGVLQMALDDELIQANPAQKLGRLGKPAGDKRDAVKPLSQEAVSALLGVFSAKHRPYYPFVLLLARTGLRAGEALALTWGDVDLSRKRVRVHRNYTRGHFSTPKTAGSDRRVDMTDQLAQDLRELFLAQGRQEDKLLFEGDRPGIPMDLNIFRRTVWKNALVEAGLPHHRIHDLRHTYATLLIMANVPPQYVQNQLGHRNLTTTLNVYSHWLPDASQSFVDVLDEPEPFDYKCKVRL